MSKKPKPAKPVVSAIPTWQEMKTVFGHVDGYDNGFKAIQALVTSRVVAQKVAPPPEDYETAAEASARIANKYKSLDPIKAIVEMLEALVKPDQPTSVLSYDQSKRFLDTLSALKRSLTGSGE
jgi:hypothetical protein